MLTAVMSFGFDVLAAIGAAFLGAGKRWGWPLVSTAVVALVLGVAALWFAYRGPSQVELVATSRRAQAEVIATVERTNSQVSADALEKARAGEAAAAAARRRAESAEASAEQAWAKVRELLAPGANTVCFQPDVVEAMRRK